MRGYCLSQELVSNSPSPLTIELSPAAASDEGNEAENCLRGRIVG